MALTLVEAAKLSTDQLRRGVIETVVERSPLFNVLPFINVEGNAFAYRRENALPGVEFRAVNSGYTESTGTFTNASATLAILGGDADVDRYIVQTRGGTVADHRAAQAAMKAKAVRLAYTNTFINGDTGADANSFDGLNKILDGTSQELTAAGNGLLIAGADDAARQDFFDQLDALIAAVDGGPDMIFANAQALAKIRSSARRLTMNTALVDRFGVQLDTYNGIPLVDAGYAPSGTAVIGNAEVQGSSSAATSIYAVRFGDDAVTGITNGGVQVYDLGEIDDKPVFRTRIEFYCGVAVMNLKAAAVLRGVLA